MNTIKWVLALAAILVVSALAGQIGKETARSVIGQPEGPGSLAVLSRMASELNKTMPMMVDSQTELSNVGALPNTVVYHYRLVDVENTAVKPSELIQAARPPALKRACSTPETRDGLLKRGITMRFSYSDKERTFIGAFDVAPADCRF